jgi:hypothetical protein
MGVAVRRVLLVGLLLAGGGCLRATMAPPSSFAPVAYENPVFLAQGHADYQHVFDHVYDVVAQYFPIHSSNIFAGQIESRPLISAGVWDAARFDFYDGYELWESSLQTIRRRAIITIAPADCGGYFVDVKVYKELEDLPQPAHAAAGAATIRTESTVERTTDVVDVPFVTRGWIPIGRDCALEALIVARLKECY